jgi:hypothetical protein
MLENVNKFTDVLNMDAVLFMFVYATHGMTGLERLYLLASREKIWYFSLLPQTPI